MRYEIRAKVREYEDKKTGETKSVYATIGSAWLDGDKKSIQLDTVPVSWDGRAFINEPFNKDQPMTQAQALNGGKDFAPEDIDDKPISLEDIPF